MRELDSMEVQSIHGGGKVGLAIAGVCGVALLGIFALALFGARRSDCSDPCDDDQDVHHYHHYDPDSPDIVPEEPIISN